MSTGRTHKINPITKVDFRSFRAKVDLYHFRGAPPSSFMAGAFETDLVLFVDDLRPLPDLTGAVTLGTLPRLDLLFANLRPTLF